jgi:16S rRNA U516 pseudouridylate synthase RsuA-like enzyme
MTRCRIQKYLSEKGICSRRKAEEWILNGWISINGLVVRELGTQLDPEFDDVSINSKATDQRTTTIAYHKPRGIVTNCPLQGEREVKEFLPKSLQHLSSIGRLDKDSEGLILFTDDGVLAKYYLDSKNPHEREYLVWVHKEIEPEQIQILEDGIVW